MLKNVELKINLSNNLRTSVIILSWYRDSQQY